MPTDHAHAPLPPAPRPNPGTLRTAAIVAGALAVVIVVLGIISRLSQSHQTKVWTSTEAIPVVSLVSPEPETTTQDLVLPGTLDAFYNAPIFARVPGYLKIWYHDIGAKVKKNELLAIIDTPDLDQQLVQAKADLKTIEAKRALAEITARRWTGLLKQDAVSAQETDEKVGDLAAKTAEVNAAEAHLGDLEALKAFSRIVAPFDGVITARKTDIGYLINAGASANPTAELFDVSEVDKLRLYVSVPQVYGARVVPGVKATLTVPEYPGRSFPATITTTSNAVSQHSGTVLVELIVNNLDGALKAGDYAQTTFELPGDDTTGGHAVRLPSSTLIFRNKAAEVAVLGAQDRVVLKPVTVSHDLGNSIEISAGLSPTDKVINNPPDSITDGELVRLAPAPTAGGAHGAG